MAAVLLRLKLAIQRRGRGRTAEGQGALFWLTWLIAGAAGIGGGALVAFLTGLDSGHTLVLLVFVGLFLIWVLVPLTTPALQDQTVDPARLETYPLTTGQKVSGLLLGGLVAPTALFTLLTASGGALAPAEPAAVRAAVPVVSALFVVLCVSASRAAQALMVRSASSRRGRDVMLVLTGVVTIGGYVAIRYFAANEDALAVFSSSTLATVLEWTPPGAAGQMNLDMRDQNWADAVGGLAFVLVWIAASLGLWYWALNRRERGTGASSSRRRSGAVDAGSLALMGGPLAALRPRPASASFAQHARYLFFRHPRQSQQVLLAVVIAAFLAHTSGLEHGLPFAAALYGTFATITIATSMLNYDGRGITYLAVAGAPVRAVLGGKYVVTVVVMMVATALFVIAEATLGGSWAEAFDAMLAGAAGVIWAGAVGAYVSVRAPFDAEHRGRGRGRALLWIMIGLALAMGGTLVAAVAFWMWEAPVALEALAGLVASAALSWVLVRLAGRRWENRQLDIAHAVAAA